ncbi:MAG: tyrosine-type recombinase/integrase, partial [Lentisphaeraceae bacterium]|nr:tyrosine-type recombinase/integrase [Lentisphaeraceae bacterium]
RINTRGQRGHSFISPTTIHRMLKQVKNEGIIARHLTTMALRHSFAMELLASGHNILELMHVLGHQDIRLTLNYLRAANIPVRSPLDGIDFPAKPITPQTAVHSQVKQRFPTRTTNASERKATLTSHTKQILNKLLQSISPEQSERISLCKDSQRWQHWLDKAQNKKLNYFCYRNQSRLFLQCTVPGRRVRTTPVFCDYLFMDIRDITHSSNSLQNLQLLQECLRKTNKSLIFYAGNT